MSVTGSPPLAWAGGGGVTAGVEPPPVQVTPFRAKLDAVSTVGEKS
ncbi:hypothetical protein AB0J35_27945 [Nonomuraea angiospora]